MQYPLKKLHVSHFITMTMVNVSHDLCCFIDCFLQQIFQKTWILSIKGPHQPYNIITWASIGQLWWWNWTRYLPQNLPFWCAASHMWPVTTKQPWSRPQVNFRFYHFSRVHIISFKMTLQPTRYDTYKPSYDSSKLALGVNAKLRKLRLKFSAKKLLFFCLLFVCLTGR